LPTTNLITLSLHPSARDEGGSKLSAKYNIPGPFEVCFESRKVAKKVYKYIFESCLGINGNGVWFDPDCDALVLKRMAAVEIAMKAAFLESLSVRFLAFAPDTLHYHSSVALIAQAPEFFGNVELMVQLKRMGRPGEHCGYIERKLVRYWDSSEPAGKKRPELGILMPKHFEARIVRFPPYSISDR
jgi:hypothetical protein